MSTPSPALTSSTKLVDYSGFVRPILLGGAVIAFLSLALLHVRSYFFLFDDYALVSIAGRTSVRDVLTTPLFGFFRPLAFLATKAEFAFLGVAAPQAYIAGSLIIHAVNVALVYAFARQLHLERSDAKVAAVFFLLSPWAAESYFWLSAEFDLLAACGVLATLVLGAVMLNAGNTTRAMTAGAVGCTAAAVGAFAKEVGVLALPLFVSMVVLTRPRDLRRMRTILYIAGLGATAVVYLIVRQRVAPGLGGAYGDFGTLVGKAPILRNAWTYVRGLVVLPVPDGPVLGTVSVVPIATWLFASVILIVLWHALRTNWRVALLGLCGFFAGVAPVVWIGLIAGSSAGSRFLYLPAVWFVLLLGIGLSRIYLRVSQERSTRGAVLYTVALGILLGHPLMSLTHQARVWREASRLSRLSIEQVGPHLGGQRPLFITNLPFWFVEGPYVLKDYAFAFYFGGAVRVRARSMVLRYDHGRVFGAGDVENPPPTPTPQEHVLTLDLPVNTLEPKLVGRLEAPVSRARVTLPFTIRGWVLDTAAPRGSGVDAVHIYAYPDSTANRAPIFLGTATYGDERPDIGKTFGRQFANSGFHMIVTTLSPGSYSLAVFPHDTVSGQFAPALTVAITVP